MPPLTPAAHVQAQMNSSFFPPSVRGVLLLSEAACLLWMACLLPSFEGHVHSSAKAFCSSRLCICSIYHADTCALHRHRAWFPGGGAMVVRQRGVEGALCGARCAGSSTLTNCWKHSSCFCEVCLTAVKFEVNCFHTGLHGELEVATGLRPGWLFLFKTFSSLFFQCCMFDTWWVRNSSHHKGTADLRSRWSSH